MFFSSFEAVLGDAGKLYVSPSTIPIYRSMLPLSTIITPNYFELQVLTDLASESSTSSSQPSSTLSLSSSTPPLTLSDLRKALSILHGSYGVPHIVVSSIPMVFLQDELKVKNLLPGLEPTQTLLCLSSSHLPSQSSESTTKSIVHLGHVPLIHGYYSGVGDLFSALVLAHFHPSSSSEEEEEEEESTPLSRATSLALSKTHAILQLTADSLPLPYRVSPSSHTHTHTHTHPPNYTHTHTPSPSHSNPPSPNLTDDELDTAPLRKTRRMRARELALVRGQDILRITEDQVSKSKSKEEGRGEFGMVIREMNLWEGFWEDY